ncbi:hypothetical protein SAMN05444377_10486 [Flavobacterium fontis]|uniref:Uncharacterized protein n=1 Tax=Flavobacterium fontis TaxID=1124188 RepID=A0A1M4Z8M3_9FLAO|nr:hypothetical protein SAMN05444377_10474 [Flavobacterium fontis]SHF14419.1 hypothetical protein SAMN05444377_10486 [Flavobacterium fontis]
MKSIINFLSACRDYIDYGYALLDSLNYTVKRFEEVGKKQKTDVNDKGNSPESNNPA